MIKGLMQGWAELLVSHLEIRSVMQSDEWL